MNVSNDEIILLLIRHRINSERVNKTFKENKTVLVLRHLSWLSGSVCGASRERVKRVPMDSGRHGMNTTVP